MKKTTADQVRKKLAEVMDPELGISIVDLGLIYGISVKDGQANILMTLTTIGCPLYSIIEQEIIDKIKELGFKSSQIKITMTFKPAWTMEKMSKKGKTLLGI
jgi:metal-sulfur cluster biosynthetic enzyme